MFPVRNDLKQGDVLSPLLFNLVFEYAVRRVQVNQNGLKLNGTHQLLVYADGVNITGRSVHTLKEKAEALVFASKEIGLEVNSKQYMVSSRVQNGVRSHGIKIDSCSFEKAEELNIWKQP